jgi:hypothetical protein
LEAKKILRVLYAPSKVFQEVTQNPRYLGPMILLIIFLIAQVGVSYLVASRSYIEQTLPTGDQADAWTENATLWQANPDVTVRNNTADYINGSYYYGQTSIQFEASNTSNVQIELSHLDGSVNCGVDGFKNMSFRLKFVNPDVTSEKVTITLYSLNSSSFNSDLTQKLSTTGDVWNNLTLSVGSDDWVTSGGNANWENVTGLKMEFTWAINSSVNLLVDGLYFRGLFKSAADIGGVGYLPDFVISAFTQFGIQWFLLTGVVFVTIKGLKGTTTWKPLMVAVGFSMIIMVIQTLMLLAAYTALPNIWYPLEAVSGVAGEANVAVENIFNSIALFLQVGFFLKIAAYLLLSMLCSLIFRVVTSFSWSKSLIVFVASFGLQFLLYLLGILV